MKASEINSSCIGWNMFREVQVYMISNRLSQLIEAKWGIYASVKCAIIASDNSLLPVWHQASVLTNAWYIVDWTLGNKLGIMSRI